MNQLLHAFLFFSLTIILPVSIAAQNDEKSTLLGNVWTSDVVLNICADQSGNKYIAGNTASDGFIVKQSANNTIQWNKKISFTTNSNHAVIIGFLDIVGDTLFGCGKIDEISTQLGVGCFYFKMNNCFIYPILSRQMQTVSMINMNSREKTYRSVMFEFSIVGEKKFSPKKKDFQDGMGFTNVNLVRMESIQFTWFMKIVLESQRYSMAMSIYFVDQWSCVFSCHTF